MTHRTGINKLNVAVIVGLGMVGSSAAALAGGCGGMGYKKPMANAPQAGYVHSGAYAPGAAHPVGMGYGGYKDRHASKTAIAKPNIVDTAKAAGSFNTLLSALNATDLTGVLEGEGPFTVFAPTDEAFAKIPKADLDALLADKEKLTAVLTYHVVPGKVTAADVAKLDSATTVQGGSITIDSSDGVKVNGATVVKADVMASNGVIHVIDTVIMPN
jgi:uncharacterized surface protein with fasciclin (FAS1) repeats